MRPVKVLILVALASGTLLAASAAVAGPAPRDDGTLSVRDGKGIVTLRMRGSVIGRLAKGRLTVTRSPEDATVIVRGAYRARHLGRRTTVYTGTSIRFRIADARHFSVKLSGKGLNFSAVGQGDGAIDGWGDPAAGIFYDGTYSLNGLEFQSLPNERTRFELAAPPAE